MSLFSCVVLGTVLFTSGAWCLAVYEVANRETIAEDIQGDYAMTEFKPRKGHTIMLMSFALRPDMTLRWMDG